MLRRGREQGRFSQTICAFIGRGKTAPIEDGALSLEKYILQIPKC